MTDAARSLDRPPLVQAKKIRSLWRWLGSKRLALASCTPRWLCTGFFIRRCRFCLYRSPNGSCPAARMASTFSYVLFTARFRKPSGTRCISPVPRSSRRALGVVLAYSLQVGGSAVAATIGCR